MLLGGVVRKAPRWALALAVAALAAGVFVTGARLSSGFDGMFGEETKDRTGPVLLKSIQDMSRYQAASGNFQVVVDLEKDARYLPDALRGTRVLYVGAGSVDAYVDLGRIDEGAVTVDKDRGSATLRLPHARLAEPALDPDRSYAVSKQRGLLDRLGDFFSDNPGDERAVQRLAARHIADAAQETSLVDRAEANTTTLLRGLLRSLGFEEVKVVYGAG
ncbi:DUF4230 domain-containing protein [Streptomyces uncialis]|uniref:DUF4230 domain-containing protein n=1 Tax=Streptomyces uncialis TaxID=1048205 RepID=UPI0038682B2C|nr:DUF4230 domain-containing protein [Streptomyces uncialis]